jgi:DNA-binding transcriptional ArsR family regulator
MHGSAEWTNAPRFSMSIEQTASPKVFQFIIGKGGSKSGWQRDSSGNFARYFKYSDYPSEPMYWKEATEDDIAEAQQDNDVQIKDIEKVFGANGKKMSVLQIRTALEEDNLKVNNDWLVKKLGRSPKFRSVGDLWVLGKHAQQEEKEQQSEQKKDLKDLARDSARDKIFSAIKDAGEIGVRQLAEKLVMSRDKLNVHLEALEAAGRVKFVVGGNNTHFYYVV